MARPDANGFGRGWAGGSAVLALLFFFGIPARRRKWLSTMGVLALIVVLGGLSACGGKSTPSGTTAGSYTFTVTGSGSPAEAPAPTTTFTLTIN
jgi:ribose/xylose/arabinose/galactoside ABC-type transport system permease subunit